ncbi:hypothetical protein ACFSTD_06335 [Novosphingobium colocasiae]
MHALAGGRARRLGCCRFSGGLARDGQLLANSHRIAGGAFSALAVMIAAADTPARLAMPFSVSPSATT